MKITLKNLIKLIVLSAWIFLSVSFHSAAQGQTVYKRGATQLESLLPPAPEAASAVRFVDVPFSHSQGLACLDIPVYTVKGRELSIPVSLSYASGGVKLDEVAGVAGLGWRLEAGGCVTRTVVDMPDEFLSAELSHGMPSQAMLAKLGDPDDRSSEKAAFLRDIVWHRTDVSLDRYSYNVCGLSGSFVILDDGSVFHLSGDGVGISYAGTPFTGVTAFTLTGPDGTVYVLDVTETGRHDGSGDSPPTPTSGQPDRWTATTAWLLRTVTSRSGLETATFSYTEPAEWVRNLRSGRSDINIRKSASSEEWSVSSADTYIAESYSTRVLSSISLSGFTVSFNYATGTGDNLHAVLPGQSKANYPFRLTGICVSYDGGSLLDVSVGTGRDAYDGRIVLKSLRIKKGGGLDDRWDFTYAGVNARVSSLAQDWFGYYNGEDDASPLTRGGVGPFTIDPSFGAVRLTNGHPDSSKASYMSLLTADHDGAKVSFTYEGNTVPLSRTDSVSVSVGVRVGRITVSDNGSVSRVRTFTYADPDPDGPVYPIADMYAATRVSLSLSQDGQTIGTPTHDWTFGLHENPVTEGPSIRDTRVLYGRVTEDAGAVVPLTPLGTNLRAAAVGPIERMDLSRHRTVRVFSTDGVRAADTRTIRLFPSAWASDYTDPSSTPTMIDPMSGIREGYRDGGPASPALLTRIEEHASDDNGTTFTMLSSTDYTYSPVSRGNVLTDYRATQVMQRILQGDLRLEDIYHYPVMTSSNPGRLPVTERHVEYHSDGNEETTVTTAYTPRAGISVPARPVTVSLMSGGVTRSVSYTYPDTWDGPEQWVEGLRSAHALSIPLKRDYRIWTDSPSAIPHKSERTGYSHYTVGGAARLLPSSSVELTDGMESWREDILSRDSLGNVSSVKERGHPVASVLWSWNGLHPAAVIENAGIGEVVAAIGSQGAVDALTSSIRPSTSQLSAVDGLRDAPSLAGSHVRTFTFSPGMGLTSATDPAGIRTTYEYDTHGRLAFVRDDDGAAMEGYSYSLLSDGDGHRSARRRSYRDAGGETYSEDVVWWNTLGLKLEDIAVAASGDGRDLVTSFGSDFMMHDDVKVWLPYPTDTEAGTFQDNAAGAAASHHSSHLAFTHKKYERSSRDRVLTVAEPGLSGTHVTTYGHGVSEGMVRYVWRDNGVAADGSYGISGLSRETVTDPDGRTSMVVRDHAGSIIRTYSGGDSPTVFIYDDSGRLRAVAGGRVAMTDTLGMWRYSYDGRGRLGPKGTPGSVRTYFSYDDEDRVVSERRGDEQTEYEYDAFGRIVRKFLRKGSGARVLLEERAYDGYPQKAATLLLSATGRSDWDGPAKGLRTYARTAEVGPDGSVVGYAGTVWLYDSRERPVLKVTECPDGGLLTDRAAYDFSWNVTSRTVSHSLGGTTDSLVIGATYDIRGRLTGETSALHASGGNVVAVESALTYDDLGRPSNRATSVRGGVTVTVADSYTLRQRLSSRSVRVGGDTLFTETIGYDTSTGFDDIAPLFGGLISRKDERWTLPGGVSASNITGFAYDASGRLSRERGATTADYAYDSRGNVTSVSRGSSGVRTYRYSGDRLSSVSDGDGGTVTFSHDTHGRMTSDGMAGTVITYNHLDRPAVIRSGGGVLVRYSHLADGTKMSSLDASGAGLVYRGPFVYRRSPSGALSLESAACSGGRLTPSGAMLHVTDHLGSVRAVVRGADGVVLTAKDFGAYGKPSSVAGVPSGSAQLPQGITIRDGFTGQEDQSLDFGTPYTDFGARQYSPGLERWLVPDPLSEKYYGISPYAYCASNPISVIDDGGRDLVLVGKGNSSVTFKTDMIDMSVNISRLGVDWKGNYSFEGNRLLGVALDVAGVFDPTPTSDLANASLQWSEGRHVDAVVSALGTIPYAGDLAKLTRVGKDIRIISDAVEGVRFTKNLRKNLTRTTGPAPKGMQAHHIFPRKFEKYFAKRGIDINDPKYGVWMDERKHLSGANAYNKEWEAFFEKYSNATKEDIMKKAEELMQKVYGK